MKRRVSRSLLALLLAAGYLVGVVLGIFLILYYPIYYRQGREMKGTVQTIAAEYPAGDSNTLHIWQLRGPRFAIFDATGDCLYYSLPKEDVPPPELDELLRGYLPALRGASFRLIPAQSLHPSLLRHWMFACAPMEGGGGVFMIKNLENVQEAFLGYLISFTAFYWIAVLLFRAYALKKHELEEMRQNYIANVTHALKTPIASVQVLAETLSDKVPLDQDQQRIYLGRILRETDMQSRMVQEILTLSKLQSADTDLTKTAVEITPILDALHEKYDMLCECSGIELQITETVQSLPTLDTNENCFRQILESLIENAIKFTGEDGVICIDAAVSRHRATLCVSDTGPGISPEDLPHIFERFYKGGGSANGSGTGLGLAIAYEIAAGLGERIWAENALGKGAAFYLTVKIE